MKSEVKKKMMLNEHATDTPRSLKRAQVENFVAGNRLIGSAQKNSREKLDGNCVRAWCRPASELRTKLVGYPRHAETEFILFHLDTSIIERHEIIAGAHKWLLSTML